MGKTFQAIQSFILCVTYYDFSKPHAAIFSLRSWTLDTLSQGAYVKAQVSTKHG